jgi:nitrate/nitrite transport system substrate-binding protein
MSTFDNPFDPRRALRPTGCSCGLHASEIEHERAAALQCSPVEATTPSDEKRYEGVVASTVLRAMFPKDAARRAFLKSVGASTALAAISQFFPLGAASELFAQGAPGAIEKKKTCCRLHSNHLRDPDHHGASDGLLFEART